MKNQSSRRARRHHRSTPGLFQWLGSLSRRRQRRLALWLLAITGMTAIFWVMGAETVFVFPALLCVALVLKRGRRAYGALFSQGFRALPVGRAGLAGKR